MHLSKNDHMRKTYIRPAAAKIDMYPETPMLAGSLDFGEEEVEQMSHRKRSGWDSSAWSTTDGTDE